MPRTWYQHPLPAYKIIADAGVTVTKIPFTDLELVQDLEDIPVDKIGLVSQV